MKTGYIFWIYIWIFCYISGLLSLTDLDSRAMDAIKELHTDDAIAVFKELQESNLEHVSNKSAFLCGLIKSQRQKTRKLSKNGQNTPKKFGPDEAKIKVSYIWALVFYSNLLNC